MLRTLREHRELNEEGFTLIELMVVVLIIAILLAIAIPTFLGARGNANNRAAQSALRNGLTAEKTYFTNSNSVYTSSTPVANLQAIEPAITWIPAPAAGSAAQIAALTTPNTVYALLPAGNAPSSAMLLVARSAGGDCFYVADETSNAAATNLVGTYYYRDKGCLAPITGVPLAAVVPAANTAVNATWAKNF